MVLYVTLRSFYLRELKLTVIIALSSQCYAIMIYWLPVPEITGKRPVPSLYSLIMCVVLMCSSLEMYVSSPSLGLGSLGLLSFLVVLVDLVDQTCCRVWTIWHLMVSFHVGQYLAAFW